MIKYDYINDTIQVQDVDYQLSMYRKWLLKNHNQLCSGHFIKAIRSGDKTQMTFDWQSIYLKAEEYQFLNNYLNEINTNSAE